MRRLLPVRAAAALLVAGLALAGCGGDGGGATGLAGFAKPGTVVFVEGTIRPEGELKTRVDRAAQRIGGIDNLGEFIVEKLEEEARGEGEPFDFEREVEPWLGERAAAAAERVEADGDLSEPVVVVETSDADAAQSFLDHVAETSDEPYRDASHEGVDYRVGGDEEDAVGLIDDHVVLAETEEAFRAAVDASEGDSLADEGRFDETMANASEESLADVYVDLGAVLEQSGDEIDPQALSLLQQGGSGFEPSEATLVASVLPGEDRIEIDVSSDLGDAELPSGEQSQLLGEVPARSFAAIGASGFGEQLQEAVDEVDESGIPGEIPPGQLKSQLNAIGLDLDKLVGSLGDAAVYAVGASEDSLGGALVLSTDDPAQAEESVQDIGSLIQSTGTPGVTPLPGDATGFAIRDEEELGDNPLVIVADGDRIAIGYGLQQTLRGIAGSGAPLSSTPAFQGAEAALGDTPISAFVDGPAALRLADSLIPASDEDFEEAKRYLRSVDSIALGSGADGDVATATLIVSLK